VQGRKVNSSRFYESFTLWDVAGMEAAHQEEVMTVVLDWCGRLAKQSE
jgi:hypothetical protein